MVIVTLGAALWNLSPRQLILLVQGWEASCHSYIRVRHWEAEAFFWMQTRINLPQLLHEAECGFAQLSQSLHANFFHLFLGRHSQSHSFRWTNMARHWREKSQLKINTSSNTLFTFPVSLFIPKYPVGTGARWLTFMLLKFSHTYLIAT